MLLQPEKAKYVVLAIIFLHNFFRRNHRARNVYTPPGTFDSEVNGQFIAGSWRMQDDTMTSLIGIRNIPRKSPLNAQEIRDEYTAYFSTNGRVPWQDEYI